MTATAAVHAAKRRPGRNRELVLDALRQAGRPVGAYDLLKQVRGSGLRAPLQIYRALDRLIADGLVHKIESISAYALCAHRESAFDGPVAFAICTECGQAHEVHDEALARVLRKVARTRGFRTHAASIELSGICGICADA